MSRNSYRFRSSRSGSSHFSKGNSRNNSNSRFTGGGHSYNGARRGQPVDVALFVNKAKDNNEKSYISNNSFSDFPIDHRLLQNILKKGYLDPTAIQDQAIMPILQGKDLIGLANTGTGKTAAFLVPMIEKVLKNKNERVFIVAPTRELALQIREELQSFAQGLGIFSAILIGGTGFNKQISDLRQNPHFVIGTPGRIKDLIEKRYLDLSKFTNVVLDEVDLMVDIGFINYVKYFISLLSPNRQSLFFSATISPQVNGILFSFVKDPVTVSVKTRDTAEFVEQDVIKVKDKSRKIEELHDLLIQDGFDKVLVFGRTKWGVEKLTKELVTRGFKAAAIHGNKSQGHRQKVINLFKKDQIQVLLATDVASRGLDIEDVTHVINYDPPESYDDYVHRIGRTGRANKRGIALTFI